MRAALLLLVASALAACPPSSDGPGADAGPADGGPGGSQVADLGCDADEECGAGEICDLATRACAPGLDCTGNAGLCRFCGDPATDCGFGAATGYCSTEAGVCRRQKAQCGACALPDECADGPSGLPSLCVEGFCAAGCGSCAPGFTCQGGGCAPFGGMARCEGALSCPGGAGCPDGQTCTDLEVCLELCSVDADCAAGTICETTPGPRERQCVAGCPLGEHVLQDGVDKVCHADGRYGLPCATAGSSDGCPTGTECDADGVCQRAGCQSDVECPLPRTYCDVASGACLDGCNSVDDCGAFEVCEGGQCRPQGCLGKELSCDLGEWCCGNERYDNAATCPSGVDDGQCFTAPDPWCRPCEGNDDCADIDEQGQASFCYELQDANGTSLGKYCSVGCATNADCPRGLDCVHELPTDQEGVTTSGCLDTLCPAIAGAR